MSTHQLRSILAFALGFASFAIAPTKVQSLPIPPPAPPPTGNPKPGGTFDVSEVDQNRFIAVAVPYGSNRYQLYILEQLSDRRACWSESGTNPTIVDLPLSNFDFTGTCRHSTDSNDYSIRLADQDLDWQWDLNIVSRGSELVLIGTSITNPNTPPLEIGRSYGISSQGFIKIFLNPGWRFALRTYEGRVTGHIYLYRK